MAKNSVTVAMVDLHMGMYTRRSTWNSVAPSTMAASSMSLGTPSKALRSRMMFMAAMPMAMTTSHLSSVMPTELNTSLVAR